jgi:hypothetical protein
MANQQSFQLTIDQVCEAVNTPVKLKFETVGDEFDGFAEENNEGTLQDITFRYANLAPCWCININICFYYHYSCV